MKVTAIIPDSLVNEVNALSQGANITQSLIKALSEWVSLKKITRLNQEIRAKPVEFAKSFKASNIRKLNRQWSSLTRQYGLNF